LTTCVLGAVDAGPWLAARAWMACRGVPPICTSKNQPCEWLCRPVLLFEITHDLRRFIHMSACESCRCFSAEPAEVWKAYFGIILSRLVKENFSERACASQSRRMHWFPTIDPTLRLVSVGGHTPGWSRTGTTVRSSDLRSGPVTLEALHQGWPCPLTGLISAQNFPHSQLCAIF
jgi:hypothetical protein